MVDIEVERFAVAMAVVVVVELVFGLKSVVDVPVTGPDVHCRPDYLDAVTMTVNHLAVAVELKVVYRSMMSQFDLDSLGLILAPTNIVAATVVEILPIPGLEITI